MFENKSLKSHYIIVFLIALVVGFFSGAFGSGVLNALLSEKKISTSQALPLDDGMQNQSNEALNVSLAEEQATVAVVSRAADAVVSVIVSKELERRSGNNPLDDFFFNWPGFDFFFEQPEAPDNGRSGPEQIGAGSGFVVDNQGLILTNRHVVADEEASYTVLTNDGQEHEAEVLARDPILDLAVLRIKADVSPYPPLELGNSDEIDIGQTVIAIGNALGEFRNTVTRGVVSGIGRTITAGSSSGAEVIEEAIQTDAAISPGNSGGPLIDLSGRVIGVNTAVSRQGENIGFAIPINEAKRMLESVEKHGRIVRPYLGVRYLMLNEQLAELNDLDIDSGALIVRGDVRGELAVAPGSPADRAGLEENDIILEVNGKELGSGSSLARVLAQYGPGDKIRLKVWHDGEEKEVDVTLDEFKE